MKTEVNYNPALKYSLHDRKISKTVLTESSITLVFEQGYTKLSDPQEEVKGNIVFENVDFDFTSVTLLSIPGNYGHFLGDRLTLEDFLEDFGETNIEVIDELYGYNQVMFIGQLWSGERNTFIEVQISIYFEGSMVYETEEQ